jgi:hypothetical protein
VQESNTGESVGAINVKIWFLTPGNAWEEVVSDHQFQLSYKASNTLEREELHTNITLLDAQITKTKLTQFFTSSSFLIPTGLNETQKDKLGEDIGNRLFSAYNINGKLAKRTANSLLYNFTEVGAAKYNLLITYSEVDGALTLFDLRSSTNSQHIIFRAERITPQITVAENEQVDGYPIEIMGFMAVITLIFLKKRNH